MMSTAARHLPLTMTTSVRKSKLSNTPPGMTEVVGCLKGKAMTTKNLRMLGVLVVVLGVLLAWNWYRQPSAPTATAEPDVTAEQTEETPIE